MEKEAITVELIPPLRVFVRAQAAALGLPEAEYLRSLIRRERDRVVDGDRASDGDRERTETSEIYWLEKKKAVLDRLLRARGYPPHFSQGSSAPGEPLAS